MKGRKQRAEHLQRAAINDYGKRLAASLIKVARPEGEEE